MAWYIPLLIYFARICDVSIGTVRTMLLLSGNRWLVPILGFCEVIIWVLAVGGVLRYLTNPIAIIAYGAGFATGVYVGMLIENRLAIGYRVVRVINTRRDVNISSALRERGYRITTLEGAGRDGPVEIAMSILRRRHVPALQDILRALAPDAFVTIERVERPSGGAWSARPRLAPIRPMAQPPQSVE